MPFSEYLNFTTIHSFKNLNTYFISIFKNTTDYLERYGAGLAARNQELYNEAINEISQSSWDVTKVLTICVSGR